MSGTVQAEPQAKTADNPPVVVKKYANRRLYNTESSSYITLDNLADMVRQGRDFVVYDAKTGEDITPPPRTSRPLPEMVSRLRAHVELLADLSRALSETRNAEKYAGEVAGKLRVLVGSGRTNRPLLLDLMRRAGANIPVHLDMPPVPMHIGEALPPSTVSLEEFLQLDACTVRVPSGGLATLKKIELIVAWAQQAGAAHEDWAMDEALRAALSAGHQVIVLGWPVTVLELRNTCATVLFVAQRFLGQLDDGSLSLPT